MTGDFLFRVPLLTTFLLSRNSIFSWNKSKSEYWNKLQNEMYTLYVNIVNSLLRPYLFCCYGNWNGHFMIDLSIWLIFVKPRRTLFLLDLLRSTDKLYFRVRISFIGHLFDTVRRNLLAVTRETFLCIFNLHPIHCIRSKSIILHQILSFSKLKLD